MRYDAGMYGYRNSDSEWNRGYRGYGYAGGTGRPRTGSGYVHHGGGPVRPNMGSAFGDAGRTDWPVEEYDYGYGGRPHRPRARPRYGEDYWELGEREMRRQGYGSGYDEFYRRFSNATRPRFSPVGGMYPAVGGRYATQRGPRPLREPTRFSDWTRWF